MKIKLDELTKELLPYFDHGEGEDHIKMYNSIKECADDLNELNILSYITGRDPYKDMPWNVPVIRFVGKGHRLYILRWGKTLKMFLRYGLSDGLWIAVSTVETVEDIETVLKFNGLTR